MSHYIIAQLLNSLTTPILGLIVYLNNKKSLTNRMFALYDLAIAIWAFSFFKMATAQNSAEGLFWSRALHVGAILMPIFFLHFIFAILGIIQERKKIVTAGYIASFIMLVFVPTNLFVSHTVSTVGFKYFVGPAGIQYHVFSLFFFLCAACGLYELFNGFRRSHDLRKNQIKYLFLALLIGYSGGSAAFLPLFNIAIPGWGLYTISISVLIISYAIVRHQLMDIEVIIKKTLVFASLFALAFGVFVGITLLMQELIAGGRLVGLAISTIIIIFTVRPLEDFLIRVTDKYLFQKKYDPFQLLKTFSDKVLASVLDKEAIIKIAVDLLVKALNLETFAIILVNKEGDKYEISGSSGLGDKGVAFLPASHVITYLGKTFSPIIKKSHDKAVSGDLVHDMEKIKAELCIPLVFHKHLVGILAFGKKKSDQEYTNDDLNILVPLSRDIAIAIVYARLYEEIRQKDKLATMGMLVAGIKHEIGNPLSSILTSTQLIMKEMETWDSLGVSQKEREEKFKNTLDEVLYESRRIGRITKKFTDFAKPGDEGVKEIVNIEDSLSGALEILQNELNLKHIRIEKNIPEDTPSIFVDKDQAHQIFFNILRNAAQAIEESKKPREESKITIAVEKKIPDSVVIDISDTGSGISEEKKKKIFEPFYTTKLKGKGTGLGLAIVRQLVGRNKGDISFKSREGEGTTFTVEFPVVQNG